MLSLFLPLFACTFISQSDFDALHDRDEDGFYSAANGVGDDCDDQDPSVHPGATETCDGC